MKTDVMKRKLRPLSAVAPNKSKGERSDSLSLAVNKLPDDFDMGNHELIMRAKNLWEALADYRKRTKRSMRYHGGDQWGDLIYNPDTGRYQKEEDYIREQGKVPLKQNVIRQLVKNLQGQYRKSPTRTIVFARNREDTALSEMMSNAIQTVHDINNEEHLSALLFLEAIISGLAIGKDIYTFIPEKDTEDIFMQYVSTNRIFFNGDLEDPRLTEIREIGEIIDMPINEVIAAFARTKEDEEKIRRWYSNAYYKEFVSYTNALTSGMQENIDFYISDNPNLCRVIEYWFQVGKWKTFVHDYEDGTYRRVDWSLKEVEQKNKERIAEYVSHGYSPDDVPLMEAERRYDLDWYVKHMTPFGHTLHEGPTPYDHKSHPYTLFAYPFIGGAVWGLVEEIIDQQRYVNRAITQYDFIIGASAKGLLLVPEDSIPTGMDVSDFAQEWSRVGGVIKYKAKPGIAAPQQVSSNSVPAGLSEMLTMQLKLTYDIMGIHQAIQGQSPRAGTPASLYAQEAENASINVKDFMEAFNNFKERRDLKIMKLIKQFYRDRKILAVKGNNYARESKIYDPQAINDVEFDLALTQGPDTPVYRQIIEDVLTNLLNQQLIDLEMYLEHSTMPYAEKLLESVKRKKQEMMQQATQQGAPGQDQALMQELEGAMAQNPEMNNILNAM
jgi:hypothetical protein